MTTDVRTAATPRQRALLEISDERDLWLRRVLDAERSGLRRGIAAGRALGYADALAELESDWQSVARPVAYPEETAARRVRAAEANCRRDAGQQERSFVARAYATRQEQRTEAQQGTVRMYPPPGTVRPRAGRRG